MPPAPKNPLTDNIWLFFLGREPGLSEAELTVFFKRKNLSFSPLRVVKNKYLLAKISNNFDPELAIKQLGGVIKIAKKISVKNTLQAIAEYLLSDLPTGKIIFSLNEMGADDGLLVKRLLKTQGRGARYIKPKNTATILHNNLIKNGRDITAVETDLFATMAIQPFEQIGDRDYNRPGRDDLSGMLPPKLAMIMINLAGQNETATLLDPFCGSGTIITEAMLMGYKKIFGSDLSPKAIANTNQNIDWVKRQNAAKCASEIHLFQTEIKNICKFISPASIDAIITEPLLGPPLRGQESASVLLAETNKLTLLYLSAFNQFKKILKITGVIIFVIPEFSANKQKITVNCLNEIKKIGFIPEPLSDTTEYLTYQRPGQHLARRIYKFTKK